jgi:predicted  nucleic acid-binding Zn-ribbon protein
MTLPDTLLAEIGRLLAGPEGRDDPARLERTLTDGYAQALLLEAEQHRLRRRLAEAAVEPAGRASREEVSALQRRLQAHDVNLAQLRRQLVRLHRRHSRAARPSHGSG